MSAVIDHLIEGRAEPLGVRRALREPRPARRVVARDRSPRAVSRGRAAGGRRGAARVRRGPVAAHGRGRAPHAPVRARRRASSAHAEELALLESRDMGKPIREARAHRRPARRARNLRFFADYAALAGDESYSSAAAADATSCYPPAGVVVAISPWNFPLMLASWKVAPGARVRQHRRPQAGRADARRRRRGSASSRSRPACRAGVLNVVHGFGPGEAGEALTRDPRVDRITFTGESATGRAIMAAAGAQPHAGLVRARRQVGERRLRRRRPRRGARGRAARRSSPTTARCASRARGCSSSAAILDEFTERFVAAARRAARRRPEGPRDRDRPARRARALGEGRRLRPARRRGGRRRCSPAAGARRAASTAAHYSRRPCSAACATTCAPCTRGDLRAGAGRSCRSTTRRDALAIANDSRLRPRRDAVDARPRPRPPHGRGSGGRARCGSTASSSATCALPFGGERRERHRPRGRLPTRASSSPSRARS